MLNTDPHGRFGLVADRYAIEIQLLSEQHLPALLVISHDRSEGGQGCAIQMNSLDYVHFSNRYLAIVLIVSLHSQVNLNQTARICTLFDEHAKKA